MREAEFRAWMEARPYSSGTISSQVSKVRKLDRYFGDLDRHIANGTIEDVAQRIATPETAPHELGNPGERKHLPTSLGYYRKFVKEVGHSHRQPQRAAEAPPLPLVPPASEEFPPMTAPTNLLLYGPPGTGKTHATALHAVRLCDGLAKAEAAHQYPDTADGRRTLMARYDTLKAMGRIAFVTFHQSYSYEDFVEGLRPETGEGPGFSLKPHPGIFRRMCQRPSVDLDTANIYQISQGNTGAGSDSWVFDEALKTGVAMLDVAAVDLTEEKFSKGEAIREVLEKHTGKPASSKAGALVSLNAFRNTVKCGDILIVSAGQEKFRAIGMVTGDYEHVADTRGFRHRRKVEWLWRDAEGLA